MFYVIRIEPNDKGGRNPMAWDEIKERIEKAFEDVGLSEEGVELLNAD